MLEDMANLREKSKRVIGAIGAVKALDRIGHPVSGWVERSTHPNAIKNALSGTWLSTAGLGVTMCSSYLGGYLSFTRGVGVNRTAFQPTVTQWVDVAELSDLSADKPTRVSAGGVPVVLVQRDGDIHALSATCVHAGGPLDEGELVDNDRIRCPWHASTFRLADGEVTRGPASVDQPSWQVKVDHGRVFVRSSAPGPTD